MKQLLYAVLPFFLGLHIVVVLLALCYYTSTKDDPALQAMEVPESEELGKASSAGSSGKGSSNALAHEEARQSSGTVVMAQDKPRLEVRMPARIRLYLLPSMLNGTSHDQLKQGLLSYLLHSACWSWWKILLVLLLATAFIVLNAFSNGIYDDYGGQGNPMLRLTTAQILVDTMYAYWWVALAVTSGSIFGIFMVRLHCEAYHRAARVGSVLQLFGFLDASNTLALYNWSSNVKRANGHKGCSYIGRSFVYYLAHIPIGCLVSVPACAYVLVHNLPEDTAATYEIFGNSLFTSGANMFLLSVVVPPLSKWLAIYRYRMRGAITTRSPLVLPYLQTQANTNFMLKVLAIILAPIAATFVFADSCLRYYLLLNPDLKSLLRQWEVGVMGFDAYRSGFCSRALLTEFSWVWIDLMLIYTLFKPSIKLILMLPPIQHLSERLLAMWNRVCCCQRSPEATLTVQATLVAQQELVTVMISVMVMAVFGPLVPWLLVLAPLGVLELLALCWHRRTKNQLFRKEMAVKFLTQLPTITFLGWFLVIGWATTSLVLVDLDFPLGAALVYCALSVAQVILLCWCYWEWIRPSTQQAAASFLDSVASAMEPVDIEASCDVDELDPTKLDSVCDEKVSVTPLQGLAVAQTEQAKLEQEQYDRVQELIVKPHQQKRKRRWCNRQGNDTLCSLDSITSACTGIDLADFV